MPDNLWLWGHFCARGQQHPWLHLSAMTVSNVSKNCQVCSRGQNHPWLRTTGFPCDFLKPATHTWTPVGLCRWDLGPVFAFVQWSGLWPLPSPLRQQRLWGTEALHPQMSTLPELRAQVSGRAHAQAHGHVRVRVPRFGRFPFIVTVAATI